MTDFYRFPEMAKISEYSEDDQVYHVVSEAEELKDAVIREEGYYQAEFEAMDVIHSAETFLRMRDHSDEVLDMLMWLTIEKNRKRGYYDD